MSGNLARASAPTQWTRRALAGFLLLMVLLTSSDPPASADQSQGLIEAHASILAGPLGIPECSDLVVDDTRFIGGAHPFSISCRVIDATGSGNGWHIFVTATSAEGPEGPGQRAGRAPASRTLAEVTGVTQLVLAGELALATGAISYPIALFDAQPAAIFDSAPESGMGQMLLTVDGRIDRQQFIRFGAPALTFSVVAGP